MSIYDYQKPREKIEDIAELRNEFIAVYDIKSKEDMVQFGLLLGNHLFEITGFEPCEQVQGAFMTMQRWIDKKAADFAVTLINGMNSFKNILRAITATC